MARALFPDRPPRTDHVVRAVLFMAHFACIFLALSMNPHAGQQRHVRDMRRRLESYGTIAFCGLLIAYFVTTPVYQLQGALGSTARMSMYIALDVVLIFALMYSATYCRNRRWRLVYRFLAASVGCSFSTDAVELLIHTGRLPQIPMERPTISSGTCPTASRFLRRQSRAHLPQKRSTTMLATRAAYVSASRHCPSRPRRYRSST